MRKDRSASTRGESIELPSQTEKAQVGFQVNLVKVLAVYEEIRVDSHRFSLCSSLRAASCVTAPGARPPPSGKSPKLTNPHSASRELRESIVPPRAAISDSTKRQRS
jgi:hypothetical protein